MYYTLVVSTKLQRFFCAEVGALATVHCVQQYSSIVEIRKITAKRKIILI